MWPKVDIVFGCLIALAIWFIKIYVQLVLLPAFRPSALNKRWEDFYHEQYETNAQKKLIIRIFHAVDEYEALRHVPTRKVVEVGWISQHYKFCMFER